MACKLKSLLVKFTQDLAVDAVANSEVKSIIVNIKNQFKSNPGFGGLCNENPRFRVAPDFRHFLSGGNQDGLDSFGWNPKREPEKK